MVAGSDEASSAPNRLSISSGVLQSPIYPDPFLSLDDLWLSSLSLLMSVMGLWLASIVVSARGSRMASLTHLVGSKLPAEVSPFPSVLWKLIMGDYTNMELGSWKGAHTTWCQLQEELSITGLDREKMPSESPAKNGLLFQFSQWKPIILNSCFSPMGFHSNSPSHFLFLCKILSLSFAGLAYSFAIACLFWIAILCYCWITVLFLRLIVCFSSLVQVHPHVFYCSKRGKALRSKQFKHLFSCCILPEHWQILLLIQTLSKSHNTCWYN